MPKIGGVIERINHILEAKSFQELQRLQLRNNMRDAVEYMYTVTPPSFKGDTWKAIFSKEFEGFKQEVVRILKGGS